MIQTDINAVPQEVHTGTLPGWDIIDDLVHEAHEQYVRVTDGTVAGYIPALAATDPGLFGIAVIESGGGVHAAGDARWAFSIQSISKLFVYALAVEELGHDRVLDIVGVDNTGLSFNSVMALELNGGHPMNPMVNAGAIATTALVPGDSAADRWDWIHEGLSAFAGRPLYLDDDVYTSEMEHNHRNRALAQLLRSYGRLAADPEETVDVYTRQCSLLVTAHDIALMGATLAAGGVNPVTGEYVVSAESCRDALAVATACGMYERSGQWLSEIGLPAKSGVSGGIVAIAPGKGAVGTFSPPLDGAGNSVRGRLTVGRLSRALGLNVFASAPGQIVAERRNAE